MTGPVVSALARSLQAFLVASCLVASMSAAGARLEALSEPESEDTPADEADTLAFLSLQEPPLSVQVDPERPELLWVPGYASREDLASRLFGDASAVGAFDFEPLAAPPGAEGDPRVRVRHPPALVPELLATMRRALDAQLESDVAWSRSLLTAPSLDRAGAAALVERGLRWSQRSDILDGSGQSYFDRYLEALAPWREEPPRWHLGDTHAQDWRLLGEASEPLRKAIALRSKRWKTRYTVTDGSPVLAPGSVVGRFYSEGERTKRSAHTHRGGKDSGGDEAVARGLQAARGLVRRYAMSQWPLWAVLAPGEPSWLNRRAFAALGLEEGEEDEEGPPFEISLG